MRISTNKLTGIIACLLLLMACSGNPDKSVKQTNELKLKVSVVSQLELGYGINYLCDVKSIEKGAFEDKQIRLMLIDSKYYQKMDQKRISKTTCTITCKRKQEKVDDNIPTINGFIDENRTLWEVVSLK